MYVCSIAALSKMRLADDGQIQELGSGYTRFGKVLHQGNEEKLVLVLPSVVILSQNFMNCLEELMTD